MWVYIAIHVGKTSVLTDMVNLKLNCDFVKNKDSCPQRIILFHIALVHYILQCKSSCTSITMYIPFYLGLSGLDWVGCSLKKRSSVETKTMKIEKLENIHINKIISTL